MALYICATSASFIPGGITTTDVVSAVAVGWITISVVWQRLRGFCASNLPPLIHACCFVAAFTDLLLQKEQLVSNPMGHCKPDNQGNVKTILLSLVTFAALGSFLCACFRSSPVLERATSKVNEATDEEAFSPCGRLVGMTAISHIIKAARRSNIIEDDIRPTIRRLKCRYLVNRLYTYLQPKWTAGSARGRVTCAFVRVLWCEGLWVALTGFAYYATMMVRVPLLEALIEDVAKQEVSAVMMLFVAACMAEVCLAGFLEYLARRLSLQIKFLMYGALFSKASMEITFQNAQNFA
ncbi:uncharacterized protein LOC144139815 [Haemaphysalis longicornis]